METDSFVERAEIEVMRVRADMRGKGPAEAFRILESKLPTLRGRKFYGAFRLLPEGEEYFACVQRNPSDDPAALGVETGTIAGGLYVRRKVFDWEKVIAEGRLGTIFQGMVRAYRVDRDRADLEYYRSMSELHLLVPVVGREPASG